MRVGSKKALLQLLGGNLNLMMDYIIDTAHEDGTWTSGQEARDIIMYRVHISPPTYYRYIKLLVEKEILLPEKQRGRGVYRISRSLISMMK